MKSTPGRLRCQMAFISMLAFSQTSLAGPLAPQWIWTVTERAADEAVVAKKEFSVDRAVTSARLVAVSDFATCGVYCNGELVATVEDYGSSVTSNLMPELRVGDNTISVAARGSLGPSAFAVRLDIEYEDGNIESVATDATWQASDAAKQSSPQNAPDSLKWSNARAFGAVHLARLDAPNAAIRIRAIDDYTQWKQALGADANANPASYFVPEGFEIELIRAAKKDEGSWISMAFDEKGRLLISKESKGLLRLTLAEAGTERKDALVELVNDHLEECRGLLFAHGSLYANANNSKGLYRLRDTNGDDHFDESTLLYHSPGSVGHGRNDLTLGPDGFIYSIHGDAVDLPADFQDRTSPTRDARRGLKTREGHVIRMDRDGQNRELVAAGLRNPYGIDFNADGEMFTYDADAEFDMGSPWYRPTRVNHILPGGDYGWRGVTQQWPPYYPDHPDAAPPNLDIGKGSPTSVQFGTHSNFPAPYRTALFVLDWAYGRILAVHLTPRGASYSGWAETFARGRPLNVTDLTFGSDGAMYFITGGRGTRSGLYRIRYVAQSQSQRVVGSEQDTARQKHAKHQRVVRHELESLWCESSERAVAIAWPHLASPDPWLRHAARLAIEHQPVKAWDVMAISESKTTAALTALLALAAKADPKYHERILQRVGEMSLDRMTMQQKLTALRIYEICFDRHGLPNRNQRELITRQLKACYPSPIWAINRELSRVIAQLDPPWFVEKTMSELISATEQPQQLHYLFVLRSAKRGWSPELRRQYFSQYQVTNRFVKGEGMEGFIRQIRDDALANTPEPERTEMSMISSNIERDAGYDDENEKRAFVRDWSVQQIEPLPNLSIGRDLNRGKIVFRQARCTRCHRLGNQGQAIGPDLTSVGNRFSHSDLLLSIVEPSKVVAEKYRKDIIETSAGQIIQGSVTQAGDYRSPKLRVLLDPLTPGEVLELNKSDVVSHTKSNLSLMPTGLLNTFNRDEILDLLAYVASGGQHTSED